MFEWNDELHGSYKIGSVFNTDGYETWELPYAKYFEMLIGHNYLVLQVSEYIGNCIASELIFCRSDREYRTLPFKESPFGLTKEDKVLFCLKNEVLFNSSGKSFRRISNIGSISLLHDLKLSHNEDSRLQTMISEELLLPRCKYNGRKNVHNEPMDEYLYWITNN